MAPIGQTRRAPNQPMGQCDTCLHAIERSQCVTDTSLDGAASGPSLFNIGQRLIDRHQRPLDIRSPPCNITLPLTDAFAHLLYTGQNATSQGQHVLYAARTR
jgi:hypothetical protein